MTEWEVHRYGVVGSTNDLATEYAAAGRGEGLVVVAEGQRRGRGRRGRRWHSPTGGNLYLSMLLEPAKKTGEWPELPGVIAAAVALSLADLGIGGIEVKHPNDVLAGGKKIAGVLLESRICGERSHPVVVGIGMNVNVPVDRAPAGLRGGITSVARELGADADTEGLLAGILEAVDSLYRLWEAKGEGAVRSALTRAGIGLAGY